MIGREKICSPASSLSQYQNCENGLDQSFQWPLGLRETEATERGAGTMKLCTNKPIQPHSSCHLKDVSTNLFSDISNLVDEESLRSQKSLG
jgi:hypothetical protein